jgi:hydrogenase nickel incorporation protein HypB
MCGICGCNESNGIITITKVGKDSKLDVAKSHEDHTHHQHHHEHTHDTHDHHHHQHHEHSGHDHIHVEDRILSIERDLLSQNNLLAERNRGYFEAKNIFAINLVSSPGSGKTTLLEKSLKSLSKDIPTYVVEGDQQTTNDADRIAAQDIPVVQINTGKACHLDSNMINKAVKQLAPVDDSILFVENVGNLVCPAMFDLGETKRVVIMSVTEGEDKAIKYPDMFHTSDLCIINKIDLLPYVNFDLEKSKEYARRVNPRIEFIELSAWKEEGLEAWVDWVKKQQKKHIGV